MKKIVQLDLFSGIGGFHLGFERAGYDVKSYFSEVDKHAIAIYKNNFKNSEYVGSVTDVHRWNIEKPNIITFGSPCQDFSLAGKRLGMEGQRSSLISCAIQSIARFRPNVFIWENVKGAFSSNNGEDFWAIIKAFTELGGYRLEWQLLNTAWFLPQNRERIYLVGHLAGGGSSEVFPIRENGREDKGSRGDVIETKEKAEISAAPSGQNWEYGWKEISPTLAARDYKDPKLVKKINIIGNLKGEGGHECHNVHHTDGIAPTVRQNHGKITMVADFRNDEGIRIRKDGDSPCLSARRHSEKDISTMPPLVKPVGVAYRTRSYRGEGGHIEERGDDLANAINSAQKDSMVKLDTNIRRLTPVECERLQGFPDNWTLYGNYDGKTKEVSDTQRYKTCGNAVTVDVVYQIAKRLFK